MRRIYIFTFLLFVLFYTGCGFNNPESSNAENKALWIQNALTTIETHPEIKAISYWHEEWEQYKLPANLKIDSSELSVKAYQTSISEDIYLDNLIIDEDLKIRPPEKGVYHSAYPGFLDDNKESVTLDRIKEYEKLAGKKLSWVYFSDDWSDGIDFPQKEVDTVIEAGSIPFVRLMAWTSYQIEGQDPTYNMQAIIDGDFDEAIKEWAEKAKVFNKPLMIEYGTEVNGNWFPWNGEWNGAGAVDAYGDPLLADGPERFKDAYKHIIDIFNNIGARNVTWAYHVNAISYPENEWNTMAAYYPGDDYIDWIGVSIYGPINTNDPDQYSFNDIYTYIYDEFTSISDNKPLAIFEFGVGEH